MSGFDADHVYTVSVHDAPAPTSPESPSETEKLLLDFLLQYRVGGEFIYRQIPLAIMLAVAIYMSQSQGQTTRKSSTEAAPTRNRFAACQSLQ
jgi:hypothetical protein